MRLRAIIERFRKILGDTPSHSNVLIVRGTGCRLELSQNQLRIVKGGIVGFLVTMLGYKGGFLDRTLKVTDISVIEITEPIFLFRYMRFTYPGAPSRNGHNLHDMLAENAVIMSLWDDRNFYRLREQVEKSMNSAVHS